ncbi:MAG: RNA pseudouridine synthase [Candidatus Theseobacter exili]|nr:RNA pseudouridine synthase [Candidatus Theseobacter exili]
MMERQNKIKSSPKKYQPRGLSILYEDLDILVVDKMSGLLTVSNETVKENTAYHLLNKFVKKGNQKSRKRIFIVHRLDRDTSGILVFAKSENAKRYLQEEWHEFKKTYYAVVDGALQEKQGVISTYLTENSAYKMYSVDNSVKGKLAKTGYKVVKESKKYSLLEIDLLTGRKNQIRVQLSEKGYPIVGDKKYGKKEKGIKRLALHAASITILHPHTKEKMTFKAKFPTYFKLLLNS